MSERSAYNHGEFCWVDLATTDIDAREEVLRRPARLGVRGRRACRGDRRLRLLHLQRQAGRRRRAGPGARGQPSAWSSYVKVADADEAAAKVKEAGGNVLMPPFELPGGVGPDVGLPGRRGRLLLVMQQREHQGRRAGQRGRRLDLEQPRDAATWRRPRTSTARSSAGTLTQARRRPPGSFFNWQVEGQKWEEGLGGADRASARHARRGPAPLAGLFRGRERGEGGRAGQRGRRRDPVRPGGDPGRASSRSSTTPRARASRSSSRTTPRRASRATAALAPPGRRLTPGSGPSAEPHQRAVTTFLRV